MLGLKLFFDILCGHGSKGFSGFSRFEDELEFHFPDLTGELFGFVKFAGFAFRTLRLQLIEALQIRGSDFVGFSVCEAPPGPGDQAVVGADDEALADLCDEDSAIGADAGIDDGQVDRAGAEAIEAATQDGTDELRHLAGRCMRGHGSHQQFARHRVSDERLERRAFESPGKRGDKHACGA